MKKKIDRLPAKVSQLGVRISMERNGARLISPSHIKFSGLMPASMLGGKAGKGRGRRSVHMGGRITAVVGRTSGVC